MWLKKVFLIFAALFYCFSLVGGCHEGERAALMSFKSLLTDPSNRLSSWKGENCCNWKGIKCSSSGHVVVVNLRNPHPDEVMINVNKEVVSSSNNESEFALKGNISPLLFTLDHIQHIDLSFNNFMFSKLPVEISNLTKLTYLNLSNSMFQDSIDMQFSNLTSLSPNLRWLEGLRRLRYLVLTGVDLSKSSESFHWVKTISSLSNLISLQLSNCNISGRIPTAQLLNLTSLSTLEMSSNVLTSSIPDILSNLTTLSVLDFSGNDLDDLVTMFSVPWSKLTYLDISFTRVGRTVPPSLSNSTSLTVFLADGCSIEGSIPPSITKLKKLRITMLNDNDITGQLPVSMSGLTSLQYLSLFRTDYKGIFQYLSKNNLNGDTPLSLFRSPIPSKFENVNVIDLSLTNLVGSIPTQIGEVHGIRSISLSGNKIHGPIPESLCQAANVLQVLDLSNNSMSGTIRRNLANCKSLIYLNLGQNKLTGTVPKELERVTSLRYLDLNGNEFEGSFPTAIEKFQDLEMLNLAGNRFEGRIPKFIGDLHHLRILVLASNSFNESIPEGIMMLENLQYIGLSRNNLSSPLPENLDGLKMMTKTQNQTTIFGYFYSLKFTGVQLEIVTKRQTQFLAPVYSYNTRFDASSNALTGKIPEKIGLLNGIPFLNLSHNNLFGLIPKTIGEMISLESLDLSYNHFTGEIPVTLTHLNFLAYLNLSYNNLSGQIPTNPQFDTLYQDGTAYVGNKYLCGTPDGMNCSNNYRPSTNEATENRYDQENVLSVLVIFSGFVTGISGVFLLLYLIDDNWRSRYWRAVDKIVSKIVNCKL
ncbi:hypothetical protein P3S67_031286 [Capsicum chacoense]